MEEQILRIMQGLKCSRQEAEEIYKTDKAIDRGEKMDFDLSADKEKVAKKMAHTVDRKKPTQVERKRAENPTKKDLIGKIATALGGSATNVQIVNEERLISFQVGEDRYEITLIAKRKPKN
jgi:hypothetical protein